MISEQAIKELEKFSKKNELLKQCFDELCFFLESPYLESFIALNDKIKDFNYQIKNSKIDLFADKDDKSFDRACKYMLEVCSFYESLERLRSLMTPKDQAKAKESEIASKNSGVAF